MPKHTLTYAYMRYKQWYVWTYTFTTELKIDRLTTQLIEKEAQADLRYYLGWKTLEIKKD